MGRTHRLDHTAAGVELTALVAEAGVPLSHLGRLSGRADRYWYERRMGRTGTTLEDVVFLADITGKSDAEVAARLASALRSGNDIIPGTLTRRK